MKQAATLARRMIAATFAFLVAMMLTPGVAHAAEPSISVNDFTLTPGVPIRQTIELRDFPDFGTVQWTLPPGISVTTGCTSNGNQCYFGAGDHTLVLTYEIADPSVYLGNAGVTAKAATFSVVDTDVTASATITIAPRANLELYAVGIDQIRTQISVSNIGPSHSRGATVTITGFAEPVNLSSGYCHGVGPTVVCRLPDLSPSVFTPERPCYHGPYCVYFDVDMYVTWPTSRLSVSVRGDYPDPDLSNNSGVAFADYPVAKPQSGSKPQTGGGSGSRPQPSITQTTVAGTPSPTPSTVESSEPTSAAALTQIAPLVADTPVVVANTGRQLLIIAVAAIVLIGLSAFGGIRLARWLSRRPLPVAAIEAPTAGPITADDPTLVSDLPPTPKQMNQ